MENIITLTSGQKIEVLMQDEVSLDIDCSLRYIESGKKEIDNYITEISQKRLDNVVENAKNEMHVQIEAGIMQAQEMASVSAKEVIDENIASIKTEIDIYVETKLKSDLAEYSNEAQQSANIAVQSANEAVTAFNNLKGSLEEASEVACGNIGDIKQTMRLRAPHGGVFCDGQILSREQYPDLYQMLVDNTLKNVSSNEYESQIATTGSCRFFAIDEVSETIRVPTIPQQDAYTCKSYVVCYTGKDTEIDITQEIELNNPFSLLDYKWSEYEITNASWLLSNGQFNSGATYISVYNLLLEIYNGTVTKDGVSVKLSTEAYEDTDFVLNTSDTTFRLPIKVSNTPVSGLVPIVGTTNAGYSTAQANLVGKELFVSIATSQHSYTRMVATDGSGELGNTATIGISADLDRATNTSLKLYFYVGETIQDANVIVASNALTDIANLKSRTIVETYSNGTSWYRVWSDGWCEQGGRINGIDTGTSLTLIKPYKDTNYDGFVQQAVGTYSTSYQCGEVSFEVVNKETAILHTGVRAGVDVRWFAYGYIR